MLKTKPIQVELTVKRKEYLTPHYIRVFLEGEGVRDLADRTVGINNKILIPPPGAKKIHFPELDPKKMKWKPQPVEIAPVIRTFTHKGIDLENNEIWIDFVAHGNKSPASAWAMKAQRGDLLGVMMKSEEKELYTKAENYLLVGDATAIPVLSAILEDLPETAKGECLLEVYDKQDEQNLPTKADIEFIYLYNSMPHKGSQLFEILKLIDLPKGDRFAYVAAEFRTVKNIRNYLRKDQNWERDEVYAFSYWKAGQSENMSAVTRMLERSRRVIKGIRKI